MSSAKRNAPTSTHAAERTIHGGGSCGAISDSTSIEPRWVNCELITELINSDSQLLTREVIIKAPLRHQLIMGTNFRHTAFFEHDDRMRFANRAEPMRDHNRRAAGH